MILEALIIKKYALYSRNISLLKLRKIIQYIILFIKVLCICSWLSFLQFEDSESHRIIGIIENVLHILDISPPIISLLLSKKEHILTSNFIINKIDKINSIIILIPPIHT